MFGRKANPTPPKSITHQRHNTSVTSHQTKPETYGGSESRSSKTANRDLFNEDKSSPTKKMYTPQKEIKDKDIQPLKQKRKDSHDSTTPRHNDANRNSIRTPKLDANTNPPCATDTRDTDKVKSRFSLRSHSYSKDSGKINSVPKHIFDTNVSTKLSDLEDSKSHPFTSVSTATASKSTDKQARIYPNQTYILDRFTTNTSQLTIDKSPQSSINPALNTLPAGSQTGISALTHLLKDLSVSLQIINQVL
ncbi:hypothetical protein LOD99_9606 [Oopsacas minuta]|uniref:Uncharacterized protein n=1 Tax=Oopsacas minuta TaxID=111878 RepID=A0AAV7KR83_9METZ|nr:hypothetical protein LOD99_9606 [Oopsacas minuta]